MSDIDVRIRHCSVIAEGEMPIRIHERLKKCMWMQQWMSALLDDGFVAVKKLKDKQCWLTKRGVAGRPATAFYRDQNGRKGRRLY